MASICVHTQGMEGASICVHTQVMEGSTPSFLQVARLFILLYRKMHNAYTLITP